MGAAPSPAPVQQQQLVLVPAAAGAGRRRRTRVEMAAERAARAAAAGGVGRGRHGSKEERQLLSRKMLRAKLTKRSHNHSAEQAGQIASFLKESGIKLTGKRCGGHRVKLSESHAKRRRVKDVTTTKPGNVLRYPTLKIVVRRKGGGRKQPHSTSEKMEAAFAKKYSLKAMGEIHDMHPRTVARCQKMGAMAYMWGQQRMLERVALALQAAPPSAVVVHEAWDETGERLRLYVPDASTCVSSTYEVFVSRMCLSFAWEGVAQPVDVEIVVPPSFVKTTSAESIFYALSGGPFTGPIQALLRNILRKVGENGGMAMILDEADAATGNDKLIAFSRSLDSLRTLRENKYCCLHQNHLGQAAILLAVGSNLVSSMYSMALALRTHGYFLRLHRAVGEAFAQKKLDLDVIPCGQPHEEGQALMAEMCQYLLIHHDSHHESADNVLGMGSVYDDDANANAKYKDYTVEQLMSMTPADASSLRGNGCELVRAIIAFKCMLTGAPWDAAIQHHCSDSSCGGSGCREKVYAAIRGVLLRALPAVPIASRWTKIGSCIDFVLPGVILWNVLPRIFTVAFKNFEAVPVHHDPDVDIEEQVKEQMKAVTSTRIKKADAFLNSFESQVRVIIIAVVIEPLRSREEEDEEEEDGGG